MNHPIGTRFSASVSTVPCRKRSACTFPCPFLIKRMSNASARSSTKWMSRSPSAIRALRISCESGSNGSIISIAVAESFSIFHVPRTKSSIRNVARTRPAERNTEERSLSAITRLRSACERIRLSNSGKKRGGAGVSPPGSTASGRSQSSLPASSRNRRNSGFNLCIAPDNRTNPDHT